ncbi:Fasciclin-2-like protein [Theileria orientalis]|uniref:Fasciclin-2-like protein n=1 Tax=Theileria orientalis TaxID=68886 RepID=A0A976MBZ4_THEOR|nr:Fasciclin-2-like protein [Theileria orientalis]
MPRVFLPQILWHSKDNKRCDRVYSIDFQPQIKEEVEEKSKNTTTLRLATGGADEFVHIWQITIHEHAPQYTHFVNNNQNSENKVEFEQPLSIKILARLVGHIGEVNSVRWSHDGRKLATGGEDRCIFLWVKGAKQNNFNDDVHNNYEEYWTRTHYFRLSNVVNTICWCPEDRVLSVSTEDGHVSLVDTQVEGTGKIRYFDGHTSFAQGVSLDPKNELLASLGSDQCLRVWKRRNQKMWKSVLVLKAARDRGDIVPMAELENNIELRKYSRLVFMSEELKTFFRRLDWSPDGRLLVAPTGIRHDKSNINNNTNNFNTNANQNGSNNDTNTMVNTNDKENDNTDNTNKDGNISNNNNTENDNTNDTKNNSDTSTVNDTNNESVPELNNVSDQSGQVGSEKNQQNQQNQQTQQNQQAQQVQGENSVYTLYVFHRKLLNFGIPMLTHQSPTGPFVVVKFCPIYLSIFDKKRQNFYNLLLNANKNKLKPIKKKLDRTSKSQLVTTNKINAYFSSVNKTAETDMSSNQELGNEENENLNEEYEYENNESGQDEDEVMTILDENTENMDVNMENTTTDTPNNIDNATTTTTTDVNMEEYESPISQRTALNSLGNTPMSVTGMGNMYDGNVRVENMYGHLQSTENMYLNNRDVENTYTYRTSMENMYSNRTVKESTYRDSTYGSYSGYRGDMEGVEVNNQLMIDKDNDVTNTTLDDYQVNTTNETENNNNGNHDEEFQMEEMNELEELDDEDEEENVEEVDVLKGVEVRVERPGFLSVNEEYINTGVKRSRMEYEQFTKEEYEEESENEDLVELQVNDEHVEVPVNHEHVEVPVNLEDFEVSVNEDMEYNEGQLERMVETEVKMERVEDDAVELEKMEDNVEEVPEVKEEGADEAEKMDDNADEEEEEVVVKMEKMDDGVVKDEVEEEEEEDKKKYNLRKTRKSVIPLMMETYQQVIKKPKNKVKKEKKVKTEEELQEEDYDTDLEEELSIPRFLFAAGTTDGSLCFYDTNENSGPIAVLKNLHFCPITDISWSPDGYVCATSSSDGYITFVIFNKRELS